MFNETTMNYIFGDSEEDSTMTELLHTYSYFCRLQGTRDDESVKNRILTIVTVIIREEINKRLRKAGVIDDSGK